MKGTIDVQIKHKDGSIETRHEHNVVFDLQALKTKYFYNREYGPLTGGLQFSYISSGTYSSFSLSTMELDLTHPSVAIPALNSITSGSSSVWYTAPITSTITDKYRISSATWTVGEAITLKSIFFPFNGYLDFVHDGYISGSDGVCVLCDDGLFYTADCVKRMLPPSQEFKFTNSYLNGFSKVSYPGQTGTPTGEVAFVPYKLHDPTERFLFDTVSGTSHYYNYYPSYSSGELQIKDAATNTVKRSFNLSQFADFVTSSLMVYSRVINTGSKNLLLQPVSAADGIRVWEIPDTATEGTIQPLGMILAGKGIYTSTGTYSTYKDAYSVADNVLIYMKSGSNPYKLVCAKINDDLSVDIVPGANAAGLSPYASFDDNYNSYAFPYINTSSPWLYRSSNGSDVFVNNGTYHCHFVNSTAANFSTPIVLAEGDVLTVSYKIEVS